jgi:hypothetical protein
LALLENFRKVRLSRQIALDGCALLCIPQRADRLLRVRAWPCSTFQQFPGGLCKCFKTGAQVSPVTRPVGRVDPAQAAVAIKLRISEDIVPPAGRVIFIEPNDARV